MWQAKNQCLNPNFTETWRQGWGRQEHRDLERRDETTSGKRKIKSTQNTCPLFPMAHIPHRYSSPGSPVP